MNQVKLMNGMTLNFTEDFIIPDKAEMHIDVGAQTNALMQDMTDNMSRAISRSAAALDAETMIETVDDTPVAEYDEGLVQTAAGCRRFPEVYGKGVRAWFVHQNPILMDKLLKELLSF